MTRRRTCPFQSTPLMRGETAINSAYQPLDEFQSTPLMRGETSLRAPRFAERSYFNPLPSCEGRRGISTLISVTCISIHSPHARGDQVYVELFRERQDISIHSPHARGDLRLFLPLLHLLIFQSTPLMRGETAFFWEARISFKISIHSPHARGDVQRVIFDEFIPISIHSPHARGDLNAIKNTSIFFHFNPLPSCEGRPCCKRL